jgi:hypothetical protein
MSSLGCARTLAVRGDCSLCRGRGGRGHSPHVGRVSTARTIKLLRPSPYSTGESGARGGVPRAYPAPNFGHPTHHSPTQSSTPPSDCRPATCHPPRLRARDLRRWARHSGLPSLSTGTTKLPPQTPDSHSTHSRALPPHHAHARVVRPILYLTA